VDPHVRHCRHFGARTGRDQIVDSLKRLEYRGYDSAGVATLEGDIWSAAAPKVN